MDPTEDGVSGGARKRKGGLVRQPAVAEDENDRLSFGVNFLRERGKKWLQLCDRGRRKEQQGQDERREGGHAGGGRGLGDVRNPLRILHFPENRKRF